MTCPLKQIDKLVIALAISATVCSRVAFLLRQATSAAELLVNQDAVLFLRLVTGQGGIKSVVDHLLGAPDFGCLSLGLKRARMIEGQNIERAVISSRHQVDPLSLR